MKSCTYCKRDNPDDSSYCRYCGNPIQDAPIHHNHSIWKKLPSWAWILIIVGSIAALIAILIGSFVGIATIEGFASIILLALAVIGFGLIPLRKPEKPGAFARALGLSFFALMGATVDQPGNPVYNKPVEMCFCEEGTSLDRDEDVSNPLPGTTYIQQDFTCFDKQGNPVKQINMFAVMGIRFIEYVIIGYILIGLRLLVWNIKNKT